MHVLIPPCPVEPPVNAPIGKPFDSSQAKIGDILEHVDPLTLRPNNVRRSLDGNRLKLQEELLSAGKERFTTIKVTTNGVIWDGHHGVRAAAKAGKPVRIEIIGGAENNPPGTGSILDLPIR